MGDIERILLRHVYLKGAALYGLYLGLSLAVLAVIGFFALAYFGKYLPGAQNISLIEYVDLRTLIIFATWLFVGTLMGVFTLTVLVVWIYNMVTRAGAEVEMGLVDPHPEHQISATYTPYTSALSKAPPSEQSQPEASVKKYTQEVV
ncbi:hypothetical protein FJZ22_02115 [Candidatus Pacearchaeota archaeon]|nr:hypothetical protein [Candidatus Pacearchaeota archaeon]